jgi:hypothetical protein
VASPDGTVIAALATDGIHVVDGSGVDRFPVITDPSPDGRLPFDGLAVAPDGTIAYTVLSQTHAEQLDLLRRTKDGAQLAGLSPLTGDASASMAFDANNVLYAHTSHEFASVVERVTPSLDDVIIHHSTDSGSPIGFAAATAIDSTGQCVVARGLNDGLRIGVRLDAYAPNGTITFTINKPGADLAEGPFLKASITPTALATDTDHHAALGGIFLDSTPIIRVYTLP